ncbi:hypothetical protein L2E82_05667 [Cichorium intybus]|uniref:Uncharacterized protein n=1 Tax=Cichorium intybus TaxID=13427 RepID=A0ACB9H7R7_CICIN|nr:hypothetical protein L2E82_05667 [Cichorium intybus]
MGMRSEDLVDSHRREETRIGDAVNPGGVRSGGRREFNLTAPDKSGVVVNQLAGAFAVRGDVGRRTDDRVNSVDLQQPH